MTSASSVMSPETRAALRRTEALAPRERLMITVLGETDPSTLSLSEISDLTGTPIGGYGTPASMLRARRFIARVHTPHGAARYRLLPRGHAAYRDMLQVDAELARRRAARAAA